MDSQRGLGVGKLLLESGVQARPIPNVLMIAAIVTFFLAATTVLLLCSCNSATWTPQVCKIMACMAIVRGLGLLSYSISSSRCLASGCRVQSMTCSQHCSPNLAGCALSFA